MWTKCPVILHHGIKEVAVCADIRLREDVVAFVSAGFTARGHRIFIQLKIRVVPGIHGLDIRKKSRR